MGDYVNILKITLALTIVSITCAVNSFAYAKNKEFKFNYRPTVEKSISDLKDKELYKAAEYSLKKGYDFFVIQKSRTFNKNANQKNGRLGQVRKKKPQMRTELIIHCYDDQSAVDGLLNATTTKQQIRAKYAE